MNEKGISLVQLRQRKTRQTAALFLAPVIILLVVFIAYPIIDTFITSGYQWNGISADKKMVGLANWAKLIKDTKFWIAFKNNVIIMILSIIIQIPLGLAMATFLDFGGKKLTIFKVIWFIPMLMSSVAIGFLFTYALATNGGIVSTISGWFGGGNATTVSAESGKGDEQHIVYLKTRQRARNKESDTRPHQPPAFHAGNAHHGHLVHPDGLQPDGHGMGRASGQ